MSETNYYQKKRDIILKRVKEYYRNNPLTEAQKKRISDYQREYRKNMADEQKQRYREAKNKRDKDKYHNITDEQKQKEKDYQKNYRKNMSDEQKQR